MNLYTLQDSSGVPIRDLLGPYLTSSYRAARAKGIAESRSREITITRIDSRLSSRAMVTIWQGRVTRV